MAIVYIHKRNDNNDVFYVGIGNNKKRAFSKSGRTKYWYNIVDKVGYSIEIIESDITIEEAFTKEKELIKYYGKFLDGGSLVNITDGGESNPYWKGKKFSQETKRKMSLAKIGKKHKPETIQKLKKQKSKKHCENISKGRLGMMFSEEHRINLSKSHIGKPSHNKGCTLPIVVKNKISKTLIGNTNAKTVKVVQYNLDGTFIKKWNKLTDIKNVLGFSVGNISSCIRGKRNTANGFIWKYE